jgi:hypothetical protein
MYKIKYILILLLLSNNAISKSSLPIILAWINVEEQSKNIETLVNQESNPKVASILIDQAKISGLPLIFPLYDIDDLHYMPQKNIINRNYDKIIEASKRYSPNIIIVANLKYKNDEWLSDWYVHNKNLAFNQINNNLEILLKNSLNKIFDKITTSKTKNNNIINLIIKPINNFKEYISIINYLKSFKIIKNIGVKQILAKEIHLQLKINSNEQNLLNTLKLKHILEFEGKENEVYTFVKKK